MCSSSAGHVRPNARPPARARWYRKRPHRRSSAAGPGGALGHQCTHGHAALSQALDRTRPRLPDPHVPCLVRGPAWPCRLKAAHQDRHPRLASLFAMGAGYGRHRHGERRRGGGCDPGLELVRVALRGAQGEQARVCTQGGLGRRARRLGRALRASPCQPTRREPAPRLPFLRHHRFCPLRGRQCGP